MKKIITLFLFFSFSICSISQRLPDLNGMRAAYPLQPLVTLDSTNLPIVGVYTNFQSIPNEPKINAIMGIINHGYNNINHVNDSVNDFLGNIGIEKRGSVSQLWPQPSYSLETRDSLDSTMNISLLGMPKEHDWILYGPYDDHRSEEHTSELQSPYVISYAVF